MNLVVLMAGDSLTSENKAKHLLEKNNHLLIEHIVNNIKPLIKIANRSIFVLSKEMVSRNVNSIIRLLVDDSIIITAESETNGALCSALLCADYICDSDELIIFNGEQIINVNYSEIISQFRQKESAAGTIYFDSLHPRWSYITLTERGRVTEAAEKKQISCHATAGFYYFRHGSRFIEHAENMLYYDLSYEDKFFVCPIFNEYILADEAVYGIEIDASQYESFMDDDLINKFFKKNQNEY